VLSTYVAISLYRAIRSPPLPSSDGEVPFEIRWKVVFGDVFRRPNHPEAFAVIAGASAQALATSAIWLALAFLNLVGPQAIHGLNWTSLLLIWTVSSIIAGYTTGFLLHLFNIPHWKRASVVSSHAPPAICFLIAVGVNLPYYSSTASAIPIVTLWLLPVTWMAVSVPFALLGGYLSSVDAKGVYLGRVATTPRPIYQKKPLWLHPAISFLACGILPFATAHTEIYLLMHSLWGQTSTESLYISPHVFGVFPLMLAVSALTTIVGCYYAISHEVRIKRSTLVL
jgi:transmembrane 9 superfamily protein 2/4